MRLATSDRFDSGIDALTTRQAELSKLQTQLTTQKRVNRASDDPAAAARAERALAGSERSTMSQRAVDASRNAMTQTETAFHDAEELLQQARETLVASGNTTYTDADRLSQAGELQSIRSQLFVIANRTDGAGSFLFAGQSSGQQPFADAPGGVRYDATPGITRTGAGVGMPLTADGAAAWTSARTGNGVFVTSAGAMVTGAVIANGHVADPSAITGSAYTLQFSVAAGTTTYAVLKDGQPTAMTAEPYTSGKEILVDGMSFSISGKPADGDRFQADPSTPTLGLFDMLDKAIDDLKTPQRTGSQNAQTAADHLRDIDQVSGSMRAGRAVAGDTLARIDSETSRIATQKLGQDTERNDAEGLDFAAAYSTFQTKQTGYDAALKSYSSVQRLSLFDYIQG